MSEICPRCETRSATRVHSGHEQGKKVWEVWHCGHCAFTWRDSESPAVIDPSQRPRWAQLTGVDLDRLRQLFEPQQSRGRK